MAVTEEAEDGARQDWWVLDDGAYVVTKHGTRLARIEGACLLLWDKRARVERRLTFNDILAMIMAAARQGPHS